jgi:hypothetical protein
MKNYVLFFTAMGSVFSCSCFAQSNEQTLSDVSSKNDLAIVSYHVEERINMNFGGSVRTYDVANLDMITPKDLGKDNVRIVTPKYGRIKTIATPIEITGDNDPKITTTEIKSDSKLAKVEVTPKSKDYVNIDVVATYERVMDKGYKSVAMITKVADRHFFNGDLVSAAKWYDELFAANTDLEAVYYYRYAESLKAVNQLEKSKEMMKIFETKSK